MKKLQVFTAICLAGSMLSMPSIAQSQTARTSFEQFLMNSTDGEGHIQAQSSDGFRGFFKKQRERLKKRQQRQNYDPNRKIKERIAKRKARKERLSREFWNRQLGNTKKRSNTVEVKKPVKKQAVKKVAKKLPKVESSKTYTYRTVKRLPINIVPLKLEYAAVENTPTANSTANDAPVQVSQNPVVTKMTQDLHSGGVGKLRAEKHLASAIGEHYSKHQTYAWLNDAGEWNARARSVRKVLARAGEYGLNAEDYRIDIKPLEEGADEKAQASHRVIQELAMSIAVLRYAMDAQFGRINPNRLSGYHDFPVRYGKAADVLAKVHGPGLPANTLATLHPDNEKFEALRRELAELVKENDDSIDLPTKVLIKPGKTHEALPSFVAAIKKRGSKELLEAHAETLAAYEGSTAYTPEIVEFVRDYQKEAGLGPDGIIGRKTSTALAGVSSKTKTDRLILAMERLRWLPHQLGGRHVFINQPEYRARYIVNGKEELAMRVVVGKKSNQTNFFYDEIEHVEFNPYWNVPRSIVVNEFLPKSIRNPGYLDQKGYEVAKWGGKKLSSTQINWSSIGDRPNFNVRQPPGPKNALGELKIMFPNRHAIYMHDTPAKALFNRSDRAFSHGCVRLHDPRAMAAAVLGTSRKQVADAISRGDNHTMKLGQKVPVYVSYFTAWPQEDGAVKYFADMYERDSHLLKAITATSKARATPLNS